MTLDFISQERAEGGSCALIARASTQCLRAALGNSAPLPRR